MRLRTNPVAPMTGFLQPVDPHRSEAALRLNSAFKSTQATIAFVWVLSAAYGLLAVLAGVRAGGIARVLAAGAVVGLVMIAMRATRDIRGGRAM